MKNQWQVILLAGGKSSRMGSPKGLLPLNRDQKWIDHQLSSLIACGAKRIVLVLGSQAKEYFESCPWMIQAQESEYSLGKSVIRVIVNPHPEWGQFSSLQCGTTMLEKGKPAFVLPIDCPCPYLKVWKELWDQQSFYKAIIPSLNERAGHPVLLGAEFVRELERVPLDSSEARLDWQMGHLAKEKRKYIATDDKRIFFNMNRPEDFQQWKDLYFDETN